MNDQDLKKIKQYLDKTENPLFFFDDDADGLCSYLLFKKYLGKGKGIIIKATPKLDVEYLRKISEYSPDVVFILDKPMVSQEFVDGVNVPVIWIDHHDPKNRVKGVKYFNPRLKDDKDIRCISYWCYKVVKQNLWIGTVGSISDWQIPDYLDEFEKKYELVEGKKDVGDILFSSKLGKLCRIMSFLLKGSVKTVYKHISALEKIKDPREILDESNETGKYLVRESNKVDKVYQKLLEKAVRSVGDEKLIVFSYPTGKISLTADLSNELLYKYPNKIILIAREKDGSMKLSLRSNKTELPGILEKALEDLDAYGGGHPLACGGSVNKKDWKVFLERLRNLV